MTNIYEIQKETKEVITKELIETKCDWCGNVILDAQECREERPDLKTEIEFTVRFPCYGGGEAYAWSIEDLCFSCGEKLKQLLKKNGITIVENHYDWILMIKRILVSYHFWHNLINLIVSKTQENHF